MVLMRRVCCCVNLTFNGAVIGWCTIINSFLLLATAIQQVVQVFNVISHRPALQVPINIIKTLGISYFFINLLSIIASALVIVGIAKRTHSLLKPWLIINIFALIMFFLKIMHINDLILHRGYHLHGILWLILQLILFGLEVYLYLAVLSLFQIYRDELGAPKYEEPYSEERRLLVRPGPDEPSASSPVVYAGPSPELFQPPAYTA